MLPVKCECLYGYTQDAAHGWSSRVEIPLSQPCPACNGLGYLTVEPMPTCGNCRGTGKVAHENLLVLLGAIAEYDGRTEDGR